MSNLKIAYIGNFEPEYSTENDVRKAFEHLGHEVVKLQENKAEEVVKVRKFDFDLLLITGTWDCTPEILAEYLTIFKNCADRGIPTATSHLDTFWGTSRGGRKWWLHPMFHTAYIFTADGDYQDKWELFGKNHIWLPPAVRFDAAHFGTPRPEYECDVAFVGSNGTGYHEDVWSYRKELVNSLKEMCNRNGWKFKNPGGESTPNWGKVNRDDDLNDFYASAKVTVGDSLCIKKESAQYWSDRVPEATGRGGLLIMPQIDMLATDEFYGKHFPMYPWGNFDALEEMIRKALENDKWRADRQLQFQAITKDKHTYVNRVQTILKTVGLV